MDRHRSLGGALFYARASDLMQDIKEHAMDILIAS